MKHLTILSEGHGHFRLETEYHNKTISALSTNTHDIDIVRGDYSDRKKNAAKKRLIAECISDYKLERFATETNFQ